MEATEPHEVLTSPERNKGTLWGKLKTFFFIASILGLVSFNVLTLLSDTFHSIAFNTLSGVLSTVVPEMVLSKVLSRSAAVRRQADIMVATKAIQAEKSLLIAANNGLEAKRAAIQNEKNILTAANKSLEAKHAALELSRQEIEAKHNELKRVSLSNAASAKNISKRITARSAANASRNVSSVGGESIPLIGTAIIIGVTAWDLYDACQMIKDANELNAVFGHAKEDETKICGLKVPTKEEALAQVKDNWRLAYQTAAESINQAGAATMSLTPPKVYWIDIKGTICPVLGYVPMICP